MQASRPQYFQLTTAAGLHRLIPYLALFMVLMLLGVLGHAELRSVHALPVLWIPVGISLAAMYLLGSRALVPIVAASLLSGMFIPLPWPLVLAATLASVVQSLLGYWSMRALGFNGELERMKDAFILLGLALCISTLAPSIILPAQLWAHLLQGSALLTWLHMWSICAISILTVTPLLTTWFLQQPRPKSDELAEFGFVYVTLAVSTVFLFIPQLNHGYSIFGIYALLALLMWVGLRFEVRFVTLAIFTTTLLGLASTMLSYPMGSALSAQIFTDQLFFELLAVIFLVFSSVSGERRLTAKALSGNVQELELAVARISSEDRAKSEFIAVLAHELRNPLSPIVSTLEWLQLQELSPEAQRALEGARAHSFTMKRLLDDLLDVARVSQQNFKLRREMIDLHAAVARCAQSAGYIIREKHHSFSVSFPAEQVWLDADPIRFEQILGNLLNNAAKYTPEGGVIELTVRLNGSTVLIDVRDNGIGLSAGDLTTVFEPFHQVRAGLHAAGLGIGLSLTKRLVEMHGGSIKASSPGLGKGSTFTVELPLPPKESLPILSTVSVGRAQKNSSSAHTILIVDDNAAAADGLAKLLKLKGHSVEVAYDGTSALSAVQFTKPNVVLLDIGLPDISGYDVAKQLRRGRCTSTLIALTGYGQEEDKARAKVAGFDHHLTKPASIAEIESLILKSAARG